MQKTQLPYLASIPGQGTKIPHAMGQLSPYAGTTEPVSSIACELQLEKFHAFQQRAHMPQQTPSAAKYIYIHIYIYTSSGFCL